MRQLFAYLALSAAMTPVGPRQSHAEDRPKVLMFVRDGSEDLELMLTEEVGVMQAMIEKSGFDVDVATVTGEPMRSGSIELVPELKLGDADMSRYVGLALPCMAPAPGSSLPEEAMAIVETAVSDGKPILAARGSVAILARAGGLEGRNYAFAREVDVKARTEFSGGSFMGTGVVRDGNISTSGVCPLAAKSLDLPDGTEEVTRHFIESLAAKN